MINSFLKKHWKSLFVVAAVGCVLWTLRHSMHDIGALPKPDVALLLLTVVMFLIHYLVQAFGWHLILRSLGEKTTVRLSMNMWYMSLIARWMPGRVWYSASRLLLGKQRGLSVPAISFAMVLELIYILTGGVLVTLGFAAGLFHGLLGNSHMRVALIVVVAIVAACGALSINPAMLLRLYEVPLFHKVMKKIAGGELDSAARPTMTMTNSLMLITYYTIFWLYSGIMFGVLAASFVPMTVSRWMACIPAFAGSWLVGFFSIITPAGLGAREGTMWLMLRDSFGHTNAAVLAIVSRLMMIGVELLSVVLASIFLIDKKSTNDLLAAATISSDGVTGLGVEGKKSPIKVCVIASTYPRHDGDAAVPWLREDVARLRDSGVDVEVFAPSHKGLKSHTIDGVQVHRFRYFFSARENLTHDEGAPTKIRRLDYLLITVFYILFGTVGMALHQRRRRFDILHVHWPFPHAIMAIVATWFTPAQMVMSFHGAELLLSKKFKFVDPALKSFTRRAAALTCNSSYTAEAVRLLGTHEPTILPYGSPITAKITPLPEAGKARNILYVGRLIERKGVEYLIDAMLLIRDKMNVKLTIVGNGNLLDTLKARVVDCGLSDSVEFMVDVPETELIREYERCEVFVLPAIIDSRGDTEGLGVVLIEALSFGRPIVASNVGGIIDVIIHRKTGLLTPQKDTVALSTSIIELLSDRELAQTLATDGVDHVKTYFAWDRIIECTVALYESVLGDKRLSTADSNLVTGDQ